MYEFNGLDINSRERKERDLYLRARVLGNAKDGMTGYMGIDKPWLKYYSEDAICQDFEEMSIYQLMEKRTKKFSSFTAISYFGKKITFGKQKECIDKIADILSEIGIIEEDIVIMSLPAIPEAQYLFYAINKIGAVVYSIDPRASVDEFTTDIVIAKPKAIFALNLIMPKLDKISEAHNIPNIVSVSPAESMQPFMKIIVGIRSKKQDISLKYICWNEFMRVKPKKNVNSFFSSGKLAVIIHTGGSTGNSKGVQLSNENCNALIYQLIYSEIGFAPKKRFLNILPPFIALGLINAYHLSTCLGLESILIPTFEAKDFPKLLVKYKPNLVMAGPIHFNFLINDKNMKKADLSFLEICVSGGDTLPVNLQKKIQEFFDLHKVKAKICIGYGATETSSGAACVPNKFFRFGSVGVPYLNNTFELYDTDTGERIQGYDKTGELYISGPTTMLGYYGNASFETDKVIYRDKDGNVWYKTGDLAHFDSDGFVYIDGRIKRIIVRRGWKIYPAVIEEIILRHPAVKKCSVVGIPHDEDLNVPVAYIVLDDRKQEKAAVEFAKKTIASELPDYTKIEKYIVLDEIPLTPIGKVDYRKLEQMAENMI